MKEKILCIRLNDELVSKINELSSQYNISKSNLIRRMLYSFISSQPLDYQKTDKSEEATSEVISNDVKKEDDANTFYALTSLSKEHYLLKKKVEEMERKQEKIYNLLMELTSQLKTALQKQ